MARDVEMAEHIDVWQSERLKQISYVLTALDNQTEIENFLRDLLTEKELLEIGARFEAAQMLNQGATYVAIMEATGLSSRTVARISNWLNTGTGGYATAIATLPDK